MEPLKLYVHKDLIAPDMSYSSILYPFWGLGVEKKNLLYLESSLEKYGYAKEYFALVDTHAEAEYILVPHEYWRLKRRRPDILQKIIEFAHSHDKPLLVDAGSDEAGVVRVPNARVLRINQFRFEVPAYEIKIPVHCEDLLQEYCGGSLTLRQKSDIPSIGFVGWANMPLKQRIRSLIKELPIRVRSIVDQKYSAKIKGVFWRERANQIFEASHLLKTNFIIRSSYSGHAHTVEGEKEKNRKEFIDNILNNDYSLVIRGDANEATRFYEVLSLGRIPVLIDTAVVLPLEHLINYREFCVIIDHKDIKKAPDLLADFHAKLTPEAFVDMQRKARYAFETFLRYDKFSKYLVEMLRASLPR